MTPTGLRGCPGPDSLPFSPQYHLYRIDKADTDAYLNRHGNSEPMRRAQVSPSVLITGVLMIFVIAPALFLVVSTTVGDVQAVTLGVDTAAGWAEGTFRDTQTLGSDLILRTG